jgi:AhpD family alkylhydroperoxidase
MNPTVKLVGDSEATGAAAKVFALIRERGGRIPNIYRALANSPRLLRAWTDLAWPLRSAPKTPRELRELAILRVAALTECQYEAFHHRELGRRAGLTAAQLDAVGSWRGSEVFDDLHRSVLELTDEMIGHDRPTTATLHVLRKYFDDEQLVELVLTIAFYRAVAMTISTLAVPLDEH